MDEHENCDNCNYCGAKFVCPKCDENIYTIGVIKGLKLAMHTINNIDNRRMDGYDLNVAAINDIEELIKQYSGDV